MNKIEFDDEFYKMLDYFRVNLADFPEKSSVPDIVIYKMLKIRRRLNNILGYNDEWKPSHCTPLSESDDDE